ncbi:MAG: alpha/beta family hydrolase [Bryobacteraceae bacterium]
MRAVSEDGVRGFLHEPAAPTGDALVLTHGAGANCDTALLIAVAKAFEERGWVVLRCDLPFRQMRPKGPPFPAQAAADRQGLNDAVDYVRPLADSVFLGGHSYGGRQASILASETKKLDEWGVGALLLLSYPLHPPAKPEQLRTVHFPKLWAPSLFVSGTKDGFGTPEEMESALSLIPGRHELHLLKGEGHGLGTKHASAIADAFVDFVSA